MRSDGIRQTSVPDAAQPGGGSREPERKRGDLRRLRAAWRRQSLSSGWLAEDDWWTAAVDAVARAACRDGSLWQACAMLGRARAHAGVGITEAMTDVAALYRVLGEGTPPLDVITSLAEGWADAGLARMSGRGGGYRWSSSSATICGRLSPAGTRCRWTARGPRSHWCRSPTSSLSVSPASGARSGPPSARKRACSGCRPEDAERLLDGLAH